MALSVPASPMPNLADHVEQSPDYTVDDWDTEEALVADECHQSARQRDASNGRHGARSPYRSGCHPKINKYNECVKFPITILSWG